MTERELAQAMGVSRTTIRDAILRQHANILASIKARDPYKSYTAMNEHIKFVMDYFNDREE